MLRTSRFFNTVAKRSFSGAPLAADIQYTASDALKKSCYLKIDFKIHESASVYDAMKRMAAHDIGCLAVTDSAGDIIGVVSERDYLCKVALLGRNSRDTNVGSIFTHGDANLVVANSNDDIELCMEKVLSRDIRHLLVRDVETKKLTGLLSIKDLVKVQVAIHRNRIAALEDTAVGGLSRREAGGAHEI